MSICLIAGPFNLTKIVVLAFLRFLVSKFPSLGSFFRPILGNTLYEHVPDTPLDDDHVTKDDMDDIEVGRASGLHARGRSPGPVNKDLNYGGSSGGSASSDRDASRSTSVRPGGMRLGGGRTSSVGPQKSELSPNSSPSTAPIIPLPVVSAQQVKSGADEWKDDAGEEGWGDEFE